MIAPIDNRIWQPKPQPNTDVIDRAVHGMMDVDGNGNVTKDEWKRAGRDAASFALFDANHDGKISENEFAATRKLEREFNAKDYDGSGFLSRFEFQGIRHFGVIGGGMIKAVEKGEALAGDAKDMMLRCMPPFIRDRFASFDADRDGKVSKEEYIEGRRKEAFPIHRDPWIRPLGPNFVPGSKIEGLQKIDLADPVLAKVAN